MEPSLPAEALTGLKSLSPSPGECEKAIELFGSLYVYIQKALDAMMYHTEQTRPIEGTNVEMENLRHLLLGAQPVHTPVMWQYRWLNPGDNPDHTIMMGWKTLVPEGNQDPLGKVRELEAYRYGGRKVYGVRALGVIPHVLP